MWNKDKSVILSVIIIKIMYAVVGVCCIAAPWIVGYYDSRVILDAGLPSVYIPLLVTLYSVVPPAVTALVCLDLLLGNIRRNQPFIDKNVRCLRIISYCCFLVAVLFIYFSFLRPFAFSIVAAAAFFGIILRVVKNCFQQAIALREENDYTI